MSADGDQPASGPAGSHPDCVPAGRIADAADLADHYGAVSWRAERKVLDHVDRHMAAFIALSPFLVMATADAAGHADASPKGDEPGFVTVHDARTLLVPDRLGNNRTDSYRNILESGRVGLLFFVPGVAETLRVNGRAEISTDPAWRRRLAARGRDAVAVLVVQVEEAYLHCAKALIRSRLWEAEAQVERTVLPSMGRMLADQIGGLDPEESERMSEQSIRERLW